MESDNCPILREKKLGIGFPQVTKSTAPTETDKNSCFQTMISKLQTVGVRNYVPDLPNFSHFRFPPRCKLYLRSSVIPHSVDWYLPTFRNNLSVQYIKVKESKNNVFGTPNDEQSPEIKQKLHLQQILFCTNRGHSQHNGRTLWRDSLPSECRMKSAQVFLLHAFSRFCTRQWTGVSQVRLPAGWTEAPRSSDGCNCGEKRVCRL